MGDESDKNDKVEILPTDFKKLKENLKNKLVQEATKEWNKKIEEKTRDRLKASKVLENIDAELSDLYDQAATEIDKLKSSL